MNKRIMKFDIDRIVTASEDSNSSRCESDHGCTDSDHCGSSNGSASVGFDNDNHNDGVDPETRREVRKMRRVMANRRSARESRERRKRLLADLQESVDRLAAENSGLAKNNQVMRQELLVLLRECGIATSALPI
jgi:bZIP transcription factor